MSWSFPGEYEKKRRRKLVKSRDAKRIVLRHKNVVKENVCEELRTDINRNYDTNAENNGNFLKQPR